MKEIDVMVLAVESLQALFSRNPEIKVDKIDTETLVGGSNRRVDLLLSIRAFDHRYKIVCEVKSNGEPRHAHYAALQLHDVLAHMDTAALPVLIAPFLSEKSRKICNEYGINYLDLHGNALFKAPGLLIDVSVPGRPASEKRALKSLFSPKAAEILHIMLSDSKRAWRVAELAKEAESSLGQVSNVRKLLLERKWAKIGGDGMVLADPDSLLDAWREIYVPPSGNVEKFYTYHHGLAFENLTKEIFSKLEFDQQATLASFSAALWIAPYARTGTHYFYASREGATRIKDVLDTSLVEKGENVEIVVLKNRDFLTNTIEPVPGMICTNPVQTYLDLWVSGDRGREAAEHLRREVLTWQ
ncbi:MAG: type IV toxin-antitoxin system AbiEi family antitoxin [Gammaproteobacteria bacterium]|nr:type IV toxin-antitoxin system AbiEi family antitoxin [Gammaproteobacteria bacterium]